MVRIGSLLKTGSPMFFGAETKFVKLNRSMSDKMMEIEFNMLLRNTFSTIVKLFNLNAMSRVSE